MILWFAGGAVTLTWLVFHDPAFDYRMVVVGALLPDLLDAPSRGAWFFHSLAAGVLALFTVMIFTRHRRRTRRRLLALPIGMLLHLLLDGVWTRRQLFWWPAYGLSFGRRPIPAFARSAGLLLAEEAAGAVMMGWAWHRFRLRETDRRRRFLRTGYLGRDVI